MRALILLAFAAVALAQPIPQQPVTCTGTPATCTFPAGSSVKVGNTVLAQAASGADIGTVVNSLLASGVQVTIAAPSGGGAYLVTTPIVLTNLTNTSLVCAAGVTLTGNTASALVTVAGGTKIAVSGCIMNGASTSAQGVLAYGTSTAPLNDLTIADNQIYGTVLQPVNIYSTGAYSLSFTYPGLFASNVKILRNTLHDAGDSIIYLNRVNTAVIDANVLYDPAITTAQVNGTINTSGTAVSGASVSLTGITSGAGITIAGTIYYFASAPSGTSGTLTASAGSQSTAFFTSTSGPLGQPEVVNTSHSRNLQISHNTIYGLANFTIQPRSLNGDPGGIHSFLDIGDQVFANTITGNCTIAAANCPYGSPQGGNVGWPEATHTDTDYDTQIYGNVATNLYNGYTVEGGREQGATANTASDLIYHGVNVISRQSNTQVNSFNSVGGVTAGSNTTLSLDTTHHVEGTGSLKAVTTSSFTGTGLLWCYPVGSVMDYNQVPTPRLDFLSTGATLPSGTIQLIVSTSNNCSSPWGAFDVPQLQSGTWVQWEFPFSDPSLWQAPSSGGPAGVQSFGIQVVASTGLPSATLNFDDLEMIFPHEHLYSHANHTARTGAAGISFYGPMSFFESKGDQVLDFGAVGNITSVGNCGAVCYSSTVNGDVSDHFNVTDLTALVRAGILTTAYPVGVQITGNSTSSLDTLTVQNILSPGGNSTNTFWQQWTSTALVNYYLPSGATTTNALVTAVGSPASITTANCLAAAVVTTPCVAYQGTFTSLGASGTTGTITLYSSNAPANATFQFCSQIALDSASAAGTAGETISWTAPGSFGTNTAGSSQSLSSYGSSTTCVAITTKASTSLSFVIAATGVTGSPIWETEPVVLRIY